jgi:hypothetical protein
MLALKHRVAGLLAIRWRRSLRVTNEAPQISNERSMHLQKADVARARASPLRCQLQRLASPTGPAIAGKIEKETALSLGHCCAHAAIPSTIRLSSWSTSPKEHAVSYTTAPPPSAVLPLLSSPMPGVGDSGDGQKIGRIKKIDLLIQLSVVARPVQHLRRTPGAMPEIVLGFSPGCVGQSYNPPMSDRPDPYTVHLRPRASMKPFRGAPW